MAETNEVYYAMVVVGGTALLAVLLNAFDELGRAGGGRPGAPPGWPT